jgi:hypothetical protein
MDEERAGVDPSRIGILTQILTTLESLPDDERQRIIRAIGSYFNTPVAVGEKSVALPLKPQGAGGRAAPVGFSEDLAISPKDFLLDKQPRTDVERIACLAFYLSQYRNIPHFKTVDLSNLNTEAAQPKFSNPTVSSNNALKMGYLAPALKGSRQLSAAGEQFVRALPDREAARKAMDNIHRRKRGKKNTTKTENSVEP